MIPVKANHEFQFIEGLKIDNVKYDYCGQIDSKTKKPDGIGLAVKTDGSRLVEGMFDQGVTKPSYQEIYKTDANFAFQKVYLRTSNG